MGERWENSACDPSKISLAFQWGGPWLILVHYPNLLLLYSEKHHLQKATWNAWVYLWNSSSGYWRVISSAPNTAVTAAREVQRDCERCWSHLKDPSHTTDKMQRHLSYWTWLLITVEEIIFGIVSDCILMQEVPRVQECNLCTGGIRKEHQFPCLR